MLHDEKKYEVGLMSSNEIRVITIPNFTLPVRLRDTKLIYSKH